jgi:uncharacterized coiled-coil protein SlyX
MKKIITSFLVFISLVVFFTGVCSAQYYHSYPYNMRRQVRYPVNPYPSYPVMRIQHVIVISEYTIIREIPSSRSVYRTSNNYPVYQENAGYSPRRSESRNYEPAYRRNADYSPRRNYKEDNAYRIDMIENEIEHLKKTVEAMSQKWDKNQKSLERLNQELRRLRELLVEYKRRQ